MKKLPTHVFGARQCRLFQTNGGAINQSKLTNLVFSQQFLVQNQNSKRVYFMEKLTSHVLMALWGAGRFGEMHAC